MHTDSNICTQFVNIFSCINSRINIARIVKGCIENAADQNNVNHIMKFLHDYGSLIIINFAKMET